MQELENRVVEIEKQIALWKGGFIVASIAILGWIGVEKWVNLPKEINRRVVEEVSQQVRQKVGPEVLDRAKRLNDEFTKIESNSNGVSAVLGIDKIRSDLNGKVSLNTKYRLRADTKTSLDAAAHDGDKSGNGTPVTLATPGNKSPGTYWSIVPP